MKLSLKAAYGCQVLAQLGRFYQRPNLPHIEELAAAESIPANYLVQILNELRTAGLITSRRGKQGGYALARPPTEITFRDVLKAVDGEVLELPPNPAGQSAERSLALWKQVAAQLDEAAAAHTIADILKGDGQGMWYI